MIRIARPEIVERIDPSKNAVLEASAGTGKTYALVHLVVDLVLREKIPLEQILVVTFTDKATREMRERVRAKLRALHDATESDTDAASAWTIDDAARRRLADALAIFDRAPISTIHAFCQRILTESAFDCARLLRQEQVESRAAFASAFRDELRVELADGPLRAVLERALDLHGAEALEESLYRWYAERGEPEPRFDREEAHAAFVRLPDRLELSPSGIAARVLEASFSHPIPKREVPARLWTLAPAVEGLRAGGTIFDALLAFWSWAEDGAPGGKTSLSYLRYHLAQAAKKNASARPFADAIERLGRAASTPLAALVRELVPRIDRRLRSQKSERGHFDFDDMLRMLRDALCSPGGEALAADVGRRYRAALVDEFQDTDRVQWDIVRRVFLDGEHRLFVIGDPKQAIYGFRHADVHTYHAAKKEILERGGQLVPLTVSYRARAPLVGAVNRILEEGFFSGVNRYDHPVTCGRPALELRAERPLPPITLLHCVGRPELRADLVRTALAERIASEIASLLERGTTIEDERGSRELSPSDVHVLCRSRTDADGIGDALSAAGIPHAFYKQEGLFQTRAARDVFVVLRAIERPDERGRRLDAWLTPFFAVPLERIDDVARDLPPEHPLCARLDGWRALAEAQDWGGLFRAMLERSGIVRRELFACSSERRLTDYQHVLELLLEETHRGRRSIGQILGRLGAFIEGRELPAGENGNVHRLESERRAVQILTMHKSKGLEAEVVFLAGGLGEPSEDRLAPHVFHSPKDGRRVAWLGEPTDKVRELLSRERQEEAERLLYVAITRAKGALYVPYFGPPPPGTAREENTSYELTAEPELDERAQLSLLFEDPLDAQPAEEEGEYELARMSGPYRVLNARLIDLVARGEPFAISEVSVGARKRSLEQARVALAGWRPPDDLLAAHVADAEPFSRLRRAHAGFDVTSYTRMKRGYRAPELEEEPGTEAIDAALPSTADDLPGGAAVGVFLHELLEHLPFAHYALEPAALLERERELFVRCAERNGIDASFLGLAAERLVRAMRASLVLADGAPLAGGLASSTPAAVELPFLHPIPERSHPSLADAPPGPDRAPLSIDRGFVRGVIDLLIEHEGRYHVIDYKSDRLPSYAPAALRLHVERNYLVQARLYTLGTLRALAIHDEAAYARSFGGLLYAFLRGMDGSELGVWTYRPRWTEVLGWERALLDDAPWGYPLPPRRFIA